MSIRTPFDNAEKLEMLERSVLDLGTEVHSLKGAVHKAKVLQDQVLGVFDNLKQLLDDKGLVTLDDFDAAVELGAALERFHSTSDASESDHSERKKETGH